MNNQDITKLIRQKQQEVADYIENTFPRKAGKIAVDAIHENFDREGYTDGGLHPWKPAKRKKKTGKAASGYKTLHSGRNNLRNSFRYRTEEARAIVYTDVTYAAIHNEGGEIIHPISRKQRVKAYETHLRKKGSQHRKANSMWKGLALTNRTSYTIKMPRRQFIGPSKEMEEKIRNTVEQDIRNILSK